MSLSAWLFKAVANRPMRVIEVGGKPYLERYFIGTWLGRKIWLHRFVSEDAERTVHNHPWTALSVILTGGYSEEVARRALAPSNDKRHYRFVLNYSYHDLIAPSINLITAKHMHRIVSVMPNTWTLMLVGKRHGRGWSFFTADSHGVCEAQQPATDANWQRTARTRREVYASRAVHEGIQREASACAYELDGA